MRRTYRVKRTTTRPGAGTAPEHESREPRNGRGRSSRADHEKQAKRWPWVVLCLIGMAFIVAVGMARTPSGEGLLVKVPAVMARGVRTVAGIFSMFLCFMVILNSVIKIVQPDNPLPRFVWGLWVVFIFAAAMWHAYSVPWDTVFVAARTGGGGGMIGAGIYWFLRNALTRYFAIVAMFLGVAVGVSLLANKSPWTPFSFVWMGALSAWQWFRDLLSEAFREHGPDPDDLDVEPEVQEQPEEDLSLEDLVEPRPRRRSLSTNDAQAGARGARSQAAAGASFSSAVSELREKMSKQQADSAGGAGAPPVQPVPPTRPPAVQAGDMDKLASEFAPAMEQPPLTEDMFYDLPPYDILQKSDPPKQTLRGKQDIDALSRVIEKTLLSFGVVAKVVNVEQGPTVARFELQPGPGVKVASIVNLSQDLALALAAQDVRIEAPIPGKSAVGIEVPNKEVSAVHLRDVLEMREFRNSRSPLTIALGKDVSGKAVVTTLDHCLHLLIAGATGSGKSVCINSIISSLLYKARPDEVKLVLIDPKRVELSVWSQVPHLIAPVVSDPKKAAGALHWAIKEMEARYEKFTKVGTRDIDRYNEVATPPGSLKPAMPYIVIVIDELSDLMMVAPAEVEDAIFRLAQMARASGIYLVVATQRPSVDVLTGTIKANIPSRIAFAVASQIDSRTILDMAGAEKLLGRGDMLFSPIGATKPMRAQGCFISEREIDELVSFVSAQAKPQFATGILAVPETVEGRETEVQDDPFFSQALRIVVEAKQASVSLLQRKLPIGYSRAARLIDAMEVKGYVGPYEGSKPREVKLSIQEYMRMFEGVGAGGTGSDAGAPGAGSSAETAGMNNAGAAPRGMDTGAQPGTPSGALSGTPSSTPAGRPSGAAGASHIDQSTFRRPSFLDKPGTMSKGSIRREDNWPRRNS